MKSGFILKPEHFGFYVTRVVFIQTVFGQLLGQEKGSAVPHSQVWVGVPVWPPDVDTMS